MANQKFGKRLKGETGTRPGEGDEVTNKADAKGRVDRYSTPDADFPTQSLYQAGQEVFVVIAGARGALGPFVVEKWLGNGWYQLRDKVTGTVSKYPEGNVHRDLPS